MAYKRTEVTVPRSQEQVRKMLLSVDADRIAFAESLRPPASVGVEFVRQGLLIRITCPVHEPEQGSTEQETRRVWRVIHWALKSRLEAIDEGLETFEQAFLPHLVDPSTGATIWESVRPAIEAGALRLDGGGIGGALALGAGRE